MPAPHCTTVTWRTRIAACAVSVGVLFIAILSLVLFDGFVDRRNVLSILRTASYLVIRYAPAMLVVLLLAVPRVTVGARMGGVYFAVLGALVGTVTYLLLESPICGDGVCLGLDVMLPLAALGGGAPGGVAGLSFWFTIARLTRREASTSGSQ